VQTGEIEPAMILTQREPLSAVIDAYKAFDTRRPGSRSSCFQPLGLGSGRLGGSGSTAVICRSSLEFDRVDLVLRVATTPASATARLNGSLHAAVLLSHVLVMLLLAILV
jgi:hypothetical protein